MFKQKLGSQTSSRRKTIAIVANSSWNIYNFRLGLIRALKQQGFRIIVIAPVDQYIQYLNETKLVKHIPLKHLSAHKTNPLRDFRFFLELYRIYKRYSPDLILHYTIKPNIFGSFAAQWAGIPTIATVTGLGYTFLKSNWMSHIVDHLYSRAFRKTKQIIFHNQDDRSLFIKKGIVPPSKSGVIPGSGVDISYFYPRPKLETGKFIFLFIGRLLKDKGLKEMVSAFKMIKAKHKRACCWVIGEMGPTHPNSIHKETIMKWVQEGHIKYFGQVKDVRTFVQKADVVVLPSYREGVPRAILESMAMGKPIITTNVAGCKDTIRDGYNGYLVPCKEVQALYEAMLRVYQYSPEDLTALGNASRTLVSEQFSEPHINKAYSTLIGSILQSPSLHRPLSPSPKSDMARTK